MIDTNSAKAVEDNHFDGYIPARVEYARYTHIKDVMRDDGVRSTHLWAAARHMAAQCGDISLVEVDNLNSPPIVVKKYGNAVAWALAGRYLHGTDGEFCEATFEDLLDVQDGYEKAGAYAGDDRKFSWNYALSQFSQSLLREIGGREVLDNPL